MEEMGELFGHRGIQQSDFLKINSVHVNESKTDKQYFQQIQRKFHKISAKKKKSLGVWSSGS